MTEISRNDLIPQLRRAFGFRGLTNFELADFVIPTWSLNREEPPFHTKRGGLASAGQNPGVGNYATIGLQFPTGAPADIRAVVRKLYITAQGAGAGTIARIGVSNGNPALTLSGNPGSWQGDQPVLQVGTRVVAAIDIPAVQALEVPVPLQNNGYSLVEDLFVLQPGLTLLVALIITNQNMNVGFYWDEYSVG